MKIISLSTVESSKYISGPIRRVVIGEEQETSEYAIQLIEIQPGGSRSLQANSQAGEVLVFLGQGVIKDADTESSISTGNALLVKPNEKYRLANTGDDILRLIWVTPTSKNVAYLKEKNSRIQELEKVSVKMEYLNQDELNSSNRYYIVRFLGEGIDAYVNLYQNAAVFYASLAVEIALFFAIGPIRLKRWFNNHPNRQYIGFSNLISLSANARILNKRTRILAENVRLMRNCYVHYQNIIWHQINLEIHSRKVMSELLPQVKKEIEGADVDEKLKEEALSEVDAAYRKINTDARIISQRNIPYKGIRIRPDVEAFIDKRLKELMEWAQTAFPSQLLSQAYENGIDSEQKRLLEEQLEEYKWRSNYPIERYDARDCLLWSSEIIEYLGFL